MSEEPRVATVEKKRDLHEETNRNAREQIEVERVQRSEKTARLRQAREEAAKLAEPEPLKKKPQK